MRGRFHVDGESLHLVDSGGRGLQLADGGDVWSMLATVGPDPVTVFGELEDERLRPLSVVVGDEVVPV